MRILKIGDSGIDVEYLSLGLTRAGFNTGGIKDVFDRSVHNALVAFQNREKIAADGIAGEVTYERLLPYLKGFDVITIEPGDTIEEIASRTGTTPEAIRTANPMLNDFNAGAIITVPFGFDAVPTNVRWSHLLATYVTEGLKARYPFVETATAGESVMDSELWYLKIGTGDKKVFFNGSHHANEWITTPVLFKFAEDYLKAVSGGSQISGRDAKTLYDSTTLFVMPLVNPDGVDLLNDAIPKTSQYYINARNIALSYPNIPFPDGWKANILGTDLNLNYPASWETAKRIKAELGFVSPAPRDYVGSAPLSALESRIVYNFTLANDFVLTVSMHTQGDVIYWKYLDFMPPRAQEIGKALSDASGYPLADTPYASSFAGYKDWYISYYNRPGYTVEIGRGTNPLPISDFNSVYPANLALLTEALFQA